MIETTSEKFGVIRWVRTDLPFLRLTHLQHLLVLQGVTLSQLFLPQRLLLKARPDPIWRAPYCLYDIVLATIQDMATEKALVEEVALELMRTVY